MEFFNNLYSYTLVHAPGWLHWFFLFINIGFAVTFIIRLQQYFQHDQTNNWSKKQYLSKKIFIILIVFYLYHFGSMFILSLFYRYSYDQMFTVKDVLIGLLRLMEILLIVSVVPLSLIQRYLWKFWYLVTGEPPQIRGRYRKFTIVMVIILGVSIPLIEIIINALQLFSI